MDMENVVKLATQAAQRFTVAEPSVFEFAPSRAREMLDEQKGGRKKKGKGKAATAGDEDAA